MSGYGIEIDSNVAAVAFGDGWYKQLGRIHRDHVLGWRAVGPDGADVLQVKVNSRDLAVRALVRYAGLEEDNVIRQVD